MRRQYRRAEKAISLPAHFGKYAKIKREIIFRLQKKFFQKFVDKNASML
jgi:hypothetical protein